MELYMTILFCTQLLLDNRNKNNVYILYEEFNKHLLDNIHLLQL